MEGPFEALAKAACHPGLTVAEVLLASQKDLDPQPDPQHTVTQLTPLARFMFKRSH